MWVTLRTVASKAASMPRQQIFLSVVTSCRLSSGYTHFGGTCFRLQGRPRRREHYENMLKELEWTIDVGQMKSGRRRNVPNCLTT